MEKTAISHTIPKTPPLPDVHNVNPPYSPKTGTPVMTPKAGDLRSVASMPSLQSFNSLQSFHSQIYLNDLDVFDVAQFGNDLLYNELDPLQTPEVEQNNPSFHGLQDHTSPYQHPLLTPELSASAGSGTSLSGGSQRNSKASNGLAPSGSHTQYANLIANNIEGLGIAENRPRPQRDPLPRAQSQDAHHQQASQLPSFPSPDTVIRRAKFSGAPRITKKPSKQLLKQRKSRTNLANNDVGGPNASDNHDSAAVRTRSSSPVISVAKHSSKSLSVGNSTSPRILEQCQNIHLNSNQQNKELICISGQNNPKNDRGRRTTPNTPSMASVESARMRGRAGASPAMQSPLRPGHETRLVNGLPKRPRLPNAAAAKALYTPSAQQANFPRNNHPAAAAAAAAAVASHHQPVTPLADKQTARNSPSTIIMSNRTEAPTTIKQQHGCSQGVPSPTPAARIHSNSQLVASASDSSPAKGMWKQAVRAPLSPSHLPKPILSPHKSASTSKMRREIRRKQNKIIPEMSSSLNQFQVDLKPKLRTSKSSLPNSAPPSRTVPSAPSFFNNQMLPRVLPQQQQQQQQQQFDNLVYAVNNPQHQGMNHMNHSMLLGPTGMQPLPACTNAANHQIPNDFMISSQGQHPGPMLPLGHSSSSLDYPASAPAQSKVYPQGEPTQHVWASQPQPQQTQRKQYYSSGASARTMSAGSNSTPGGCVMPENFQFTIFEQLQPPNDRGERVGNLYPMYQTQAHASAHANAQANAQAHARALEQSQPRDMTHSHSEIHASRGQAHDSSVQSAPARFAAAPMNSMRHSMPDLDLRRHDLCPPNNDGDTSITSDFMAQFINDDTWDVNEVDMGSQWDLMDASEPQIL